MPDSSSRHSGCAFLNQLIIKKMPYSHAHCQNNGGNSLDEGHSSGMTLFCVKLKDHPVRGYMLSNETENTSPTKRS